MIPDYLIIDEIKRREREEGAWKPEPLHLPLYVPHMPTPIDDDEREKDSGSRVVIIDMGSDPDDDEDDALERPL